MPEIQFKETHDGSKTLYRPDINETYHSIHGALQESLHVFIKMGLDEFKGQNINILEIGFGTGLNAWLTLLNKPKNQEINYTSLETIPLNKEITDQLNYHLLVTHENAKKAFNQIHNAEWNRFIEIEKGFNLNKLEASIQNAVLPQNHFDLIYFDAFAPNKQPELWEVTIFEKMYSLLKPNGKLVTYCAKGQVRRNMEIANLVTERLQGPPGKREMLRATKP
jgi:tRNA U34 5-methylaminomethyl-2-thiouridine-forming methyltransferase MnmC